MGAIKRKRLSKATTKSKTKKSKSNLQHRSFDLDSLTLCLKNTRPKDISSSSLLSLDGKGIYIGTNGNWRVKYSELDYGMLTEDLEDCAMEEEKRFRIGTTSKKKTFECVAYVRHDEEAFEKFVDKLKHLYTRWSEKHGFDDYNDEEYHIVTPQPTISQPSRRVAGGYSNKRRKKLEKIIQSAHTDKEAEESEDEFVLQPPQTAQEADAYDHDHDIEEPEPKPDLPESEKQEEDHDVEEKEKESDEEKEAIIPLSTTSDTDKKSEEELKISTAEESNLSVPVTDEEDNNHIQDNRDDNSKEVEKRDETKEEKKNSQTLHSFFAKATASTTPLKNKKKSGDTWGAHLSSSPKPHSPTAAPSSPQQRSEKEEDATTTVTIKGVKDDNAFVKQLTQQKDDDVVNTPQRAKITASSTFTPTKTTPTKKSSSVSKYFTTPKQQSQKKQTTPSSAKRSLQLSSSASKTKRTKSVAELALGPSSFSKDDASPRRKISYSFSSPLTPKKKKVTNPYNTLKKQSPTKADESTTHAKGLRNLGNTCYLNSSLQMLFSIPSFWNRLFTLRQKQLEKEEKEEEKRVELPLMDAALDIAKSLSILSSQSSSSSQEQPSKDGEQPSQKKKTTSINPLIIKQQMDKFTTKFIGYEQRDAHEFVSDLLDLMQEELIKEKDDLHCRDMMEWMDDYFKLNVKVCLTCDSCGYARNKEEMYRHLSLDIGSGHHVEDEENTEKNGSEAATTATQQSVQKALQQFFEPEKIELNCEKCKDDDEKKGCSATQTMEVISRPKALLLHLKRFIVTQPSRDKTNGSKDKDDKDKDSKSQKSKDEDNGGLVFCKNKARVTLDKSISIQKHSNNDSHKEEMEEDDLKYNIKSVVHHIGSTAFSGHYTADGIRIKPLQKDGMASSSQPISSSKEEEEEVREWISFDDGVTTLLSEKEVLKHESSQKTAYMALYEFEKHTA